MRAWRFEAYQLVAIHFEVLDDRTILAAGAEYSGHSGRPPPLSAHQQRLPDFSGYVGGRRRPALASFHSIVYLPPERLRSAPLVIRNRLTLPCHDGDASQSVGLFNVCVVMRIVFFPRGALFGNVVDFAAHLRVQPAVWFARKARVDLSPDHGEGQALLLSAEACCSRCCAFCQSEAFEQLLGIAAAL